MFNNVVANQSAQMQFVVLEKTNQILWILVGVVVLVMVLKLLRKIG